MITERATARGVLQFPLARGPVPAKSNNALPYECVYVCMCMCRVMDRKAYEFTNDRYW